MVSNIIRVKLLKINGKWGTENESLPFFGHIRNYPTGLIITDTENNIYVYCNKCKYIIIRKTKKADFFFPKLRSDTILLSNESDFSNFKHISTRL